MFLISLTAVFRVYHCVVSYVVAEIQRFRSDFSDFFQKSQLLFLNDTFLIRGRHLHTVSVSSTFQVLRVCTTDPRFESIRIVLVATDGDPGRRGMLHRMTSESSAPAANSLEGLVVMHPLRSAGGWAQSMDPKHNLKRFRTRLYGEKGVSIAAGRLSINQHSLLRLFRMWDKNKDFSQLFNPADK